MTKETYRQQEWKQQKEDSKKPRAVHYITCDKCGRGITTLYKQKFDDGTEQVSVIGKTTLHAMRDNPVTNLVSHKTPKGKLLGYLCDGCLHEFTRERTQG